MSSKVQYGQYFTDNLNILNNIRLMIQNKNTQILEPCCGTGCILYNLVENNYNAFGIEVDKTLVQICKTKNLDVMYLNFFDYNIENKYKTIIYNPPYVSYRNYNTKLIENWKSILQKCNSYLYFIEKCFYHLEEDGEMIFLIPYDFINIMKASKLRKLLYDHGTITDIKYYYKQKIFKDSSSDVGLFRYQKNNFIHKTNFEYNNYKLIVCEQFINNMYYFTNYTNLIKLGNYFDIKVGLIIGRNHIFEKDSILSIPVMMSDYMTTKKKKKILNLNNLTLNEINDKDKSIYEHILLNKEKLK